MGEDFLSGASPVEEEEEEEEEDVMEVETTTASKSAPSVDFTGMVFAISGTLSMKRYGTHLPVVTLMSKR